MKMVHRFVRIIITISLKCYNVGGDDNYFLMRITEKEFIGASNVNWLLTVSCDV